MALPKVQFGKKTWLILIIVVVLIGVASWSSYSYWQAKKQISKLSTVEGQQQLAEQEVNTILAQIKKRMILPDDETPTVATVNDVETLKKDQPFFEKAQNGDKVIIYVKAKKAIVYRPQEDLIVNVGFLAVDSTAKNTDKNEETSLTVEIRNGTQTAGLGQKIATTLGDSYQVQTVGDAVKKDYQETVVVNLSANSGSSNILSALAKELKAEVTTSLPDGEKQSQANVVVFIGSDNVSQ